MFRSLKNHDIDIAWCQHVEKCFFAMNTLNKDCCTILLHYCCQSAHTLFPLYEHQWVDVKDKVGEWYEGQILQVCDQQVLVHYKGWKKICDEWIGVHQFSDRIKHLHTCTRRNDT